MKLKPNKQLFPILTGVILALTLAASLNFIGLNQKINLSQPIDTLGIQSEKPLKAVSQDLTAEQIWQQPPIYIASLVVSLMVASAAYLMLNRFIYKE
ncbi:MAG: hypothetical protein QXN08_06350 [Nitrososphaerales archaeon]